MKKNILSFFLLCFFALISLSGCDGSSQGVVGSHVGNEPVEMEVSGRVYNNNPSGSIEDVYGNSSVDMIFKDVESGDPYATAILGILYLVDSPRYEIDEDFVKGRELLEKAWGMGVVDAGYVLFEVYGQGRGVGKNIDMALYYLEESAEKGYIKSQVTLAEDYFGRGRYDYFDTNYQLAREWFAKAAEQGDRESGVALANIFNNGLGVQEDEDLAFEWMSKVEGMSYGGPTFGFDGIAQYYEEGIGTNVNLVQAYKYRDLMGTSGRPYKESLAEKMTPEQIQEAIRLSGEWQREHNISMPNSEGYHYR